MMQVVRTDFWIDPAFDARLAQAPDVALDVLPVADEAAGWAALGRAHVYHTPATRDELPKHWFTTRGLLERCPRLLCVSSAGAGYDTVDVAACTAAGVAVVNQAGGNAPSVAEHTLAMMLSVSRRMIECDHRMRREHIAVREALMGHEIGGKVLGLVGIGQVGTRVAALAKAFGVQVIACDPLVPPAEIEARGAQPVSFHELLAQADFVSLHCPRDAGTLGVMNADAFARMKRGAIFITTARGGIHDEAALAQALGSGHLAGAGLDVWDREPPPLEHPLLQFPNVFVTQHLAGVTHEARRAIARMAADQIAGVLAGQRPPRLINPQVWPVVERRLRELAGA